MSPTAEMRPRISTWAQKHSQPFSIWNGELSTKRETPAQDASQYGHPTVGACKETLIKASAQTLMPSDAQTTVDSQASGMMQKVERRGDQHRIRDGCHQSN